MTPQTSPLRQDGPFAILGLGLIGGSLARDLSALGAEVWGYDMDRPTMRAARKSGAISLAIRGDFSTLAGAKTVILAVPVEAAPGLLERVLPFLGAARLITDAGSTKRTIVAQAAILGLGPRFMGGHPMAGDHRSGWRASRRGLFQGARVFLCPTPETLAVTQRRASRLWRAVGGRPRAIAPEAHDREVALTSHLPQLVAVAVARALADAAMPRAALGPGGRDVTRLAASSPGLWAGILIDNTDAVVAAVAACEAELRQLRHMTTRRDRQGLAQGFAKANRWTAGHGPDPNRKSASDTGLPPPL